MTLVNWAALGHYAYAFVSPNAPDPASIVRRALLLGNIPNEELHPILSSARSTRVVVFNSPTVRDTTVDGEDLPVLKFIVHFERPNETEFEGSFKHGG